MTRREWKLSAAKQLPQGDSPLLIAELLLCFVLKLTRSKLIAFDSEVLTSDQYSTLELLLQRRRSGEPLAYITETREFYGRDFFVSPAVLIPRQDTESLIEYALHYFSPSDNITFLDLGTGSGCIAVTLASERKNWNGCAVDISDQALLIAKKNADYYKISSRLSFIQSDFRNSLPFPNASFDLIISNPPYVSTKEYDLLDPAVRDFEPRLALISDEKGLFHCRAVEKQARFLLKPGGLFLMEHGWKQGSLCRSLCSERYWQNISTGRDLAARDRFLIAIHRTSTVHPY